MKTSACSLFVGFAALTGLHAQEPRAVPAADPFVRDAAAEAAQPASVPKVVSICFETFSLDLADAAGLYHKKLTDGKLYAELTARVAKGQAKQENFSVIRARSGERAIVENISEFIYPTEFVPPAPSQPSAPPEGAKPAAPSTPVPATPASSFLPAMPSSFETRNIGFTLEVEPTIGQNDPVIDLRISPGFVTLVERVKWGQGVSETEMPVFESQRINMATTLTSGQPQMLGTPSRPPVSKVDADSANRVWLSFVTADIIPVVKE